MTKPLLLLLLCCSLPSLVEAQRLPQTVVPAHYKLVFGPDLKAATFTGDEVTEVRYVAASKTVTMNCAEIKILKATITSGSVTQDATPTFDEKTEQVTLTTARAVPAGPATIAIHYTGILNDQLRGFYLSKGKARNYATTQFESTDARRAFPSFDEPAFKATFDVTLIVDKGDTAFSNGAQVSDTPGPGDARHTVKFATTPRMSTYLVAMVVGDLTCQTGDIDGIPLRVCATPDRQPQLGFALEATRQVVHFYNQYYGIKYPFGKLDQLGIPDFSAGAMENTAAITYRETYLLIDDKTSSIGQRKNVTETVAHEIAHQWFGDLVTMKWWDDIWLNEGFATWMSSKPIQAWQPKWNADLDDVQGTQAALRLDGLASTRPIHQSANTPEEIEALFDGVAYGKAAAVLRMVESYVRPEQFRKGVNNYLEKYKYGNTVARDFWTEIALASGKPVDRIMPTFVNQAGAPLLHVSASCSSGRTNIAITQQRWFVDPALMRKGSAEIWEVPVCLKTANSGQAQCRVITRKEQTLTMDGCSQWVFANAGAAGYYRTSYSGEDLTMLEHALNALSPGEKIAFLGDEWALVSNGTQSVASFLDLISNLQNERSRAVMDMVIGPLSSLRRDVVTEADKPAFDAWVRRTLQPLIQDLGLKPVDGEDPERAALRATVMQTLGRSGDPQVLAYAREVAEGYMKDPASVPAEQAGDALTLIAQQADAALYDRILERRKAAVSPTEFYRYQSALTAFRDPVLIKRTLEMLLSPEVRSQDLMQMLYSEIFNPAGREAGLKFLETNFDEIRRRTVATLGGGLGNVVAAYCDAAGRDAAAEFIRSKNIPGNERALKLGLEAASACIGFKAAQSDNLHTWLATHAPAG